MSDSTNPQKHPKLDVSSDSEDEDYAPELNDSSDSGESLASEGSDSGEIDLADYLKNRETIPVPRKEESGEEDSEGEEEEENPEPQHFVLPTKRPREEEKKE